MNSKRNTLHRAPSPKAEVSVAAVICGVVRFIGWVILYANEWESHSNNRGTTHSLAF